MSSRLDRATFGPLYDLLFARFPEHRSAQGLLDVDRLAGDCGTSHETVYRLLRKNRLSPKWAKKIIEISGRQKRAEGDPPPITKEDVIKFVLV